jgi:hypothetical protein
VGPTHGVSLVRLAASLGSHARSAPTRRSARWLN